MGESAGNKVSTLGSWEFPARKAGLGPARSDHDRVPGLGRASASPMNTEAIGGDPTLERVLLDPRARPLSITFSNWARPCRTAKTAIPARMPANRQSAGCANEL